MFNLVYSVAICLMCNSGVGTSFKSVLKHIQNHKYGKRINHDQFKSNFENIFAQLFFI